MKTIFILRGLPGSGKSTRAKELANHYGMGGMEVTICSADLYFSTRNADGYRYEFSAAAIKQAHAVCFMCADRAMANGYDVVIIDNTNIKVEHFEQYIDLGRRYGYRVEIERVGGTDEADIREFTARQIHAVPESTIRKMAEEFESYPHGTIVPKVA